MYDDNKIFDELVELCDYCISDELTLSTLQVKVKSFVNKFPLHQIRYQNFPLLHIVCLSKSVTLDIVEYMLAAFPGVVTTESEDDGESVDTYKKFPLHCACYNHHCPSSIISLLIERYPNALEHFAQGDLFMIGDHEDFAEGLPLHYYVARKANVDIDMIKMLIEAYPQAMQAVDGVGFTPLHAIVSSEKEDINNILHIIKYLIEVEPSCVRTVDEFERTPLLLASCNTNITLDAVQLLYNAWPESIRIPSESIGYLPLHYLCQNIKLGEAASIDILQFMVDADPGLVREMGDDELLPIHHAIYGKSTSFCQVLIDIYPESLRVGTRSGMLPIHIACCENDRADAVDTIQYMLELHLESVDVICGRGLAPIHLAAQGERADIVELILKYDPDAASKASRHQNNPNLPLQWACAYNYADHVEVVEVLFDAYPQAIDIPNGERKTPLDLAWEAAGRFGGDPNKSKLVNFLLTQQAYARQAQDIEAKTAIDKDDWLILCCALKDNASLGSIKLFVMALRSVGHTDPLPLNTACEFCSVKVVRYLVELDNIIDEDLASMHLLHSACRGANSDVIKYFLDEHISLVSSAEVNENGELPIHLLCEAGKNKVDVDSTEYVEIIWRMLLANPEAVAGCLR